MPACPRCHQVFASTLMLCPTCLLDIDELEPTQLSSLTLGAELGRGGMGIVYRAHHKALDREVAVKLLSGDTSWHQDFHRRLQREARILARLDHTNIVKVFDAGEDREHLFIAMELVDGRPLSELLPLSMDEALRVTALVADALAHAHDRGVVHRDIKPSNIFLSHEGDVKVGDFGIARLVNGDVSVVTQTNVAIGSPQYMSPEALLGEPPAPCMDIYSLGVVLYQCIQDSLPIGVFPSIAEPADGIVRKALASAPDDRFKSAGEMALALRSTRKGVGGPHRRWLAGGLVVTATIAATVWGFRPAETQTAQSGELLFRHGERGNTVAIDQWFGSRTNERSPQLGDYLRTGSWDDINQQAVVRFASVVGDGVHQLPPASMVTSASLTLAIPYEIQYADGEANAVYQMLVAWQATDGWGASPWSGGATLGVDLDNIEAAALPADSSERYLETTKVGERITHGNRLQLDVTSIVQAWSDGEANQGFLLQSLGQGGGDGLFMASSRWHNPELRPTLRIRYQLR